MRIEYAHGKTIKAVLLARTDTTLRVAAQDRDDVLVLTSYKGTWVSEDCEPVQIQFEWERRGCKSEASEADCICSKELAARLVHLLLSGEEEESELIAPLESALGAPANRMIV